MREALFWLGFLLLISAASACNVEGSGNTVYLNKPGVAINATALLAGCGQECQCVFQEAEETVTCLSHLEPTLTFTVGQNAFGQFIRVPEGANASATLAYELRWLSERSLLTNVTSSDHAQISSILAENEGYAAYGETEGGWKKIQSNCYPNGDCVRCGATGAGTGVPSVPPSPDVPPAGQGNAGASNGSTGQTGGEKPAGDQEEGGWFPNIFPFFGTEPAADNYGTSGAVSEEVLYEGTTNNLSLTDNYSYSESPALTGTGKTAEEKNPLLGLISPYSIIAALVIIGALVFIIFQISQRPVFAEQQHQLYQTLSNETRLRILAELEEADRIPTDLSLRLEKSKSTVIEHLEKLVEAGLVERVASPGKKFVFYRLTHLGKQTLLRNKAA